ncbi:unnamed protein product [Rotaria sordida]|uniref:Cytochrome b5 heme-binding domain-containing protein n=1 Tax=Rotaria sordida TaxID=392033 RepID=A0A814USK9_9BILA|nr:unnamed protein product [Rotaria sordida]
MERKFEEYQELSKKNDSRVYVSIASCIHDVSNFIDSHSNGQAIIKVYVDKDAIVAFYGSVHHHGTSGHNILAMMRVAVASPSFRIST